MIPATLPYMFTGYRLSLGMAWLVIVAAEMLTGSPGLGGFLWQEYNSLVYSHILLSVLAIGLIGFVLDRLMGVVERRFKIGLRATTWQSSNSKDVSKNFPRHGRGKSQSGKVEVLRDINLSIRENEFVCIVGRSGAGKTTLISLIAGLIEADSGSILLEGQADRRTGTGPRRDISKLLFAALAQRVRKRLSGRGRGGAATYRRRRNGSAREHYIDLVNLGAAMNKVPRELSGGMRQRVAVARGLAMEPRVLLLDEPFSALDALTRGTLQEELARIWTETRKTVVMITNDIDEAILLADTIYTLNRRAGSDARTGDHSRRGPSARADAVDRACRAVKKPGAKPSKLSPEQGRSWPGER